MLFMLQGKNVLNVGVYCLIILFSCQKKTSDFAPQTTGSDSIILVKTASSFHYDDQGRFITSSRQVYDYSDAPQKVVISLSDSQSNIVNNYVESFQYDSSNRLAVYNSTKFYDANRIDFKYNSNNELTETNVAYPNGNNVINTFAYKMINGHKTIIVYDTANVNDSDSHRPRIATYTFDDSNRIIKSLDASTNFNKDRSRWYLDTDFVSIDYNSQGNVAKAMDYYSYFNGNVFIYMVDSTIFTRETRGSELFNTALYTLRNVYWYSLPELAIGFTQSNNAFGDYEYTPVMYNWRYPVRQIEDWSTYYTDPQVYINGLVQNTFDANGLLTHLVYPPGFGSKYGGQSIFDYTYTKIKK
jgi:hypothetical protein